MEKDLYRGHRKDPKAGPHAPDKTGKPITPGKMQASAASILNKSFKEAKEKQEYDYEGDMAISQLKSIIANAQRIHDMLERDTNIPEWVQSKITLAEDYIVTAANYMQGEMKEETLDELTKATVKSYLDKKTAKLKSGDGKDYPTSTSFRKSMEAPGIARAKLGKTLKRRPNTDVKIKATNEEVAHSVHVKTYDSQGEKQMNSPEFKKHIEAHGGKLDYASDKGVAFKFASHSHAASFHRGVQSKFRELDSEHDVHEEVAVNAAGAGNVAGIGVGPQGEPGVHMKKKKKVVLASFKRFARK